MDDVFRQVSVGVLISAMCGLWVFAATRASTASVSVVRDEVKNLESKLDEDINRIRSNTDEIKDTFHRALIDQTEFRAQVREKLDIDK
tara:strand:- start:5970 stop:6233 length:264 start_codon:yes stop_codon:yes gene_type:complete